MSPIEIMSGLLILMTCSPVIVNEEGRESSVVKVNVPRSLARSLTERSYCP